MRNEGSKSVIEQAIPLIQSANHITVLTGAGISTPSGIPDFRTSNSGLWEKVDPMEAISLSKFLKDPEHFYQWLYPFANQLNEALPNAAHLALAAMQKQNIVKSIITQNIDDLHNIAGGMNTIELHGNIKNWQCLNGHELPKNKDIFLNYCKTGQKPVCHVCQRILKPAIVFFEEALPYQAWEAAHKEATLCDLMIVVGSSLVVGPANELPYIALQHGAKLIIVTLSDTPLDPYATLIINADVATTLSAWEQLLGL
jgi:NAD-dependent deacetylase